MVALTFVSITPKQYRLPPNATINSQSNCSLCQTDGKHKIEGEREHIRGITSYNQPEREWRFANLLLSTLVSYRSVAIMVIQSLKICQHFNYSTGYTNRS
jgi:hypothetical protein